MEQKFPIGIFDSGYGGLTVMKEIVKKLPQYDYIYLGDNARAPYGNRSFETVYQYTLQCVKWLFAQQCSLVILACNTASAKALRSIQQQYLPTLPSTKKVLGVIRPTTEMLGMYSYTNQVGILATTGTVASNSYEIELKKFWPQVKVFQHSCPMWVPLVENNEIQSKGADYFVKKDMHLVFEKGVGIDVLLLACTHFPLLRPIIEKHLPIDVKLITQGEIVAESLQDYLFRHSEINNLCSQHGTRQYYTTDDQENFNKQAEIFYGETVQSSRVDLVF